MPADTLDIHDSCYATSFSSSPGTPSSASISASDFSEALNRFQGGRRCDRRAQDRGRSGITHSTARGRVRVSTNESANSSTGPPVPIGLVPNSLDEPHSTEHAVHVILDSGAVVVRQKLDDTLQQRKVRILDHEDPFTVAQ